jgi:iron complex outermembrane receptor protein
VKYADRPRLTITLGERADYNTRYGGTFNPRLGFVAQPTGRTTLKVLFGTAYLAPSPFIVYKHYGSFFSTDGGQTYTSSFWHVGNPGLKPEHKKTVETELQQMLTDDLSVSASAFYTRFSGLIERSDFEHAGPGFVHGWPVEFIEAPANEGREITYGGSIGLAFVKAFQLDGRVEARAALSVANGYDRDNETPIQIGAMAPVQFRGGMGLDLGEWSFAPRLAVVGIQRTLATAIVDGSLVRRTLPGDAAVDVNIRRRRVFKNLNAFLTIENVFDERYRNINIRAFTNPEELAGAPQNPRRVTVGFEMKTK